MPLNVAFASKDAANPFAEQLAFFQAKLNLPSERWDDIMQAAHDRAFIVAGAAQADLVNDLHGAIANAIENGTGLDAFRKDFNAIVLKNGWTGWTGEGSAAGQAWRTRIIYQTNMATSYAAGRYQQLTNPELLKIRPYWKYVHADGVAHPRPLHLAWNGLVLPYDDEFWDTHYPPNGWCCHCRVTSADAGDYADAQAAGLGTPPAGWDDIDPKTGAPVGIDKGFDYAPGANVDQPLASFIDNKLINLDAPVGAAMYQAMRPVLQAEQSAAFQAFLDGVLADPVKRGRMALVGAIDPATLDWLSANKGIAPATAEIAVQDSLIVGKKAVRHQDAGDALTPEEWATLPDMLANPDQILYDTNSGKLLFVANSSDPRLAKLAVEFDYKLKKGKGDTNLLVSAFKILAETIAGDIAGGLFEVVK
jgi:hypothetical protein